MQNRAYKIAIFIFALTCVIGSAGTVFIGRMYPILPISVAFGALYIYISIEATDDFRWPYLFFFIGFSTFYRSFIFLYPASLTGADADKYAFTMARILVKHSTSTIEFGFYKKAPLYLIFGANISQITGMSLRYALTSVAVLIGIVIPATAYIVGRQLSPRTGHIAALLTVVAPSSVLLSFNPVAQSLSVVIFMTLFITFLIYTERKSRTSLLLLLVLLFSLYWTHKLAPQMIALATVAGLFIAIFNPIHLLTEQKEHINRSYTGLAVIFVIGAYLQWIITDSGSSVIFQLVSLLTGGEATTLPVINPTAAEPTIPSQLVTILGNVGYLVPLVVLGGLGWLLLWWQHGDQAWAQVLLGLVGFYLLLAIGSKVGLVRQTTSRFLLAIVPFLAILIAYAVDRLLSTSTITTPRIKMALALILVVATIGTQSISLLGPRDSTVTQRAYLTESELAGKIWGYEYISSPISTDQFYASEIPPSKLKEFAQQNSNPPDQYRGATVDILNSNFRNISCYGAIRTHVRRYNYQGRWRLTYDPITQLDSFNVIYSNGGVTVFPVNSSC